VSFTSPIEGDTASGLLPTTTSPHTLQQNAIRGGECTQHVASGLPSE